MVEYLTNPAIAGLFLVALALALAFALAASRRAAAAKVDPWAMQRELMAASGQALPAAPEVNETSVLYFALTLEELSETADALHSALVARGGMAGASMRGSMEGVRYDEAMTRLRCSAVWMLRESKAIRAGLAETGPFSAAVTLDEAEALLDGVTDVVVTTAGLALASGLPAAAGYVEVVGSNLSKKNPATGVIDKTPDGKWIKGTAYRPPDLAAVFEREGLVFVPSSEFGTMP